MSSLKSTAKRFIASFATMTIGTLILVGCTTPAPAASEVPADSPGADGATPSDSQAAAASNSWTLPLASSEGGCSGSVTLQGSANWVIVEDRLYSGQEAELTAYCDDFSRYSASDPTVEPNVQSLLDLIYPQGNCSDAPSYRLSGQSGSICSYDYEGTTYTNIAALIGPKFVQIQAARIDASEKVNADVETMLSTAVVTLN